MTSYSPSATSGHVRAALASVEDPTVVSDSDAHFAYPQRRPEGNLVGGQHWATQRGFQFQDCSNGAHPVAADEHRVGFARRMLTHPVEDLRGIDLGKRAHGQDAC